MILTRFPAHSHGSTFQSLSGFLMRCDGSSPPDAPADMLFQSLSGFLMRCDEESGQYIVVDGFVSIPIGFSDAL